MSRESCLYRRPKGRFLEIRIDWLRYCKGNKCAAALLSVLANWTDWKIRKKEIDPDDPVEVFLSMEQIRSDMIGLFSLDTIRKRALPLLEELGAVTVNRTYGHGSKFGYTLNCDQINADLMMLRADDEVPESWVEGGSNEDDNLGGEITTKAESDLGGEITTPEWSNHQLKVVKSPPLYKEDKNREQEPENKNQDSLSFFQEDFSSSLPIDTAPSDICTPFPPPIPPTPPPAPYLYDPVDIPAGISRWKRFRKAPTLNGAAKKRITEDYAPRWSADLDHPQLVEAMTNFFANENMADKDFAYALFWKNPLSWLGQRPVDTPAALPPSPTPTQAPVAAPAPQSAAPRRDFEGEWNGICTAVPCEGIWKLAYGPHTDEKLAARWQDLATRVQAQHAGKGWLKMAWLLKKAPGDAKYNWDSFLGEQKAVPAQPDIQALVERAKRIRAENEAAIAAKHLKEQKEQWARINS